MKRQRVITYSRLDAASRHFLNGNAHFDKVSSRLRGSWDCSFVSVYLFVFSIHIMEEGYIRLSQSVSRKPVRQH